LNDEMLGVAEPVEGSESERLDVEPEDKSTQAKGWLSGDGEEEIVRVSGDLREVKNADRRKAGAGGGGEEGREGLRR